MRRPDLGFAIPIALDMQAFRERPLCRRFDFHVIRPWGSMRQRPVIDIPEDRETD